jgi:hypothetical protein
VRHRDLTEAELEIQHRERNQLKTTDELAAEADALHENMDGQGDGMIDDSQPVEETLDGQSQES